VQPLKYVETLSWEPRTDVNRVLFQMQLFAMPMLI
jgi:hypothetical protein